MTGLAIGHSETQSAARRRKEQYRQDLEQQISSNPTRQQYVIKSLKYLCRIVTCVLLHVSSLIRDWRPNRKIKFYIYSKRIPLSKVCCRGQNWFMRLMGFFISHGVQISDHFIDSVYAFTVVKSLFLSCTALIHLLLILFIYYLYCSYSYFFKVSSDFASGVSYSHLIASIWTYMCLGSELSQAISQFFMAWLFTLILVHIHQISPHIGLVKSK